MFMKKKRIFLLLLIFIITFFSLLFFSKSNKGYLKGEIVVWAEGPYYYYFLRTAEEFQKSNKKVSIKVVNIEKDEYINKLLTTDEKKLPNVVQLNFIEIDKLKDKIDFFEENKSIIENYNKNFSISRVEEVKANDKYYGIPFQSVPIILYIREDILNKYGYKVEDINLWSQLIDIGNDIKNKSGGEINLFSSKDKMNITLLMLAQLVDREDQVYDKDNLMSLVSNIYKEEYITNENNYLFRVTSLDFYKEIVKNNVDGEWICKNPPSFHIGENRLYDLGGKNLVALNVEKNREVIKDFITYAATNKELLSKELLEYEFFPSSLYSLKGKHEEIKNNIGGISPFLTLMNIVERAPGINNFEVFKKIAIEIYND